MLQSQPAVLEVVFQHLITACVVLDRDFGFVRVNNAFARPCSCNTNAFDDAAYLELHPHSENEADLREVVRTKSPCRGLAKSFPFAEHLGQEAGYWDWTMAPVTDGEIHGLAISLNHVTGEQLHRQKHEKHKQHLEDLVPERTDRAVRYGCD